VNPPTPPPERKRRRRGAGSLLRKPGSRYWFAAYRFAGRQHCFSTGQTDQKRAQDVLARKLQEVGAHRAGLHHHMVPAIERTTVGDLLDQLAITLVSKPSRLQFASHLKGVREFFGPIRVVDLDERLIGIYIAQQTAKIARLHAARVRRLADLLGWPDDREALVKLNVDPRHLSLSTLNRHLQLVGQAVKPFLQRHHKPVPAFRHFKEDNTRESFLALDEIQRLTAAFADEDLSDFTWWGVYSAWRKGEISKLTWPDVTREDGRWTVTLSFRDTKARKGRRLLLAGPLEQIIEKRWQKRHVAEGAVERLVPWVFHRAGEPIKDFDHAWTAACLKVALVPGRLVVHRTDGTVTEGVTFHDLRRVAVRTLVRAGVNQAVAMRISGHASASMFRRYNITSDEDIAEALERTATYVSTLPSAPVRELVSLGTAPAPSGRGRRTLGAR
jgi:integrase